MIDSHAHLQDKEFGTDRDAVIWRAFESGITDIVLASENENSSLRAVELAGQYKHVYVLVGVHPYEFNQQQECIIDQQLITNNQQQDFEKRLQKISDFFEKIIQNPKVVGIGECGLDYHGHTGIPITDQQKEWQKRGFLLQLNLARKHQLPISVHGRPSSPIEDDAYEDILEIVTGNKRQEISEQQGTRDKRQETSDTQKETRGRQQAMGNTQQATNGEEREEIWSGKQETNEGGYGENSDVSPVASPLSSIPSSLAPVAWRLSLNDVPVILHCYQGDTEITKKFLALPNVYFSFAGNITYPVKKVLQGTKNDIREVIRLIPLDRILTETDSPFLSPQTLRGIRNESGNVRYVLEEISRIKGCIMKDVEKGVKKVFENIFSVNF